MKIKEIIKRGVILTIFIVLLINYSNAWSSSSPAIVHEHITNESKEVWNNTPYEIKNYIGGNLL